MSTSKEGLQRCIDDLHGYCAKWGLEVNASKTKSMVLSKSLFVSENFRYGNADIESVKSIQYLGFSITYSLNLKYIMTDRIDKASKWLIWYCVRYAPLKTCQLICRWIYLTNKYPQLFYMAVQYGRNQSRLTYYIWIIKTRGKMLERLLPVCYIISNINTYPLNMPDRLANWVLEQKNTNICQFKILLR